MKMDNSKLEELLKIDTDTMSYKDQEMLLNELKNSKLYIPTEVKEFCLDNFKVLVLFTNDKFLKDTEKRIIEFKEILDYDLSIYDLVVINPFEECLEIKIDDLEDIFKENCSEEELEDERCLTTVFKHKVHKTKRKLI